MKRTILLSGLLLAVCILMQAQSGRVIYEQRINLHKRLGDENPQMKAMLPEWQEWKTQLNFRDNQSIYRNYEDEESDGEINASSGGMRVQLRRPETITYQDLDKNERVQQEEFMQKRYLITEPIPETSWKITGETREVLGYTCQQAILQDAEEDREVVAWFTLQIPLASGPATYGQLPGLILVVDIDNGTSTIEAKAIDLDLKINDKTMKAPDKGIAMSREEFREEQEKARREMEKSGHGGMRIRF